MANLRFKIAGEASEYEQIHRLNHATFAEEIPQHAPDPATGLLVDRFHRENTYVIALDGDRVVGMVVLRSTRPFSLDTKVENLDSYLPPGRSPCEIRLLAVAKERRRGPVFRGLMRLLVEHGRSRGFDLAVISATTRQLKLYRHLGFTPFGPLVGTPDALYQPMHVTLETILEHGRAIFEGFEEPPRVRLLPGPVSLHPDVLAAFAAPPVSHRGTEFSGTLRHVKDRLRELTGARRVALLFGSGTLANDAVAARLSIEGGRGLVLSNGEFGERLADHARRWRLPHTVLRSDWGDLLDHDRIAELDFDWLWAVHCETSTGILNDLEALKRICRERGARLCLDGISSIATVPVDLTGVHLASGVSGKGIGSLAGISMVFHQDAIAKADLPRYLDLGCYGQEDGMPYTVCSNLVAALRAALDRLQPEDRFPRIAKLAAGLRTGLRENGFPILAPDAYASPAVTTIVLPPEAPSTRVGRELERRGYELSYLSGYLVERNWLQVCLMGEHTCEELAALPEVLAEVARTSRT